MIEALPRPSSSNASHRAPLLLLALFWASGCAGQLQTSEDWKISDEEMALFIMLSGYQPLVQACQELDELCATEKLGCKAFELFCQTSSKEEWVCLRLHYACKDGKNVKACGLYQDKCAGLPVSEAGVPVLPDGGTAIDHGLPPGADRGTTDLPPGAHPPVAVITASPTSGQAPLQVTFSGQGSSDPDGDALTGYQWSFGDGTNASGATATHTYSVSGTYSATLTVTDSTGLAGQGSAVIAVGGGGPVAPGEWTQHGHDAQHTGYTATSVAPPWRWKWAWNGPSSSGGVAAGKTDLPRNVQPVTGGGRVYIAAGTSGVVALNAANGALLWQKSPGGSINSTVAYDDGVLFVASANGTLYRLDAASGATQGQFAATGSSTLPLPPAVHGDRVFFAMGSAVHAVNRTSMKALWTYDAKSPVHTPPAYSPTKDRVVVVTEDLYAHAIKNSDGGQAWRVKPTPRTGGSPTSSGLAEAKFGWPVIAEGHGLVLIKYRLDWDTLFAWNPWPTTNSAIRSNLTQNPGQQALYALGLDSGQTAFITNLGHGGWGDGGYMPMGPQPVVKRFADGKEVVYTMIRGDNRFDGRWDSHFGEVLLDNTSVAGYAAGEVRWMQYGNYGWPQNSNHDSPPTDEQSFVSMAGDHLLHGHWAWAGGMQVVDRGAARGTYGNPIGTTSLPHLVATTVGAGCSSAFSASHYCAGATAMNIPGSEWRAVPDGGFYIYWDMGKIYDQYWTGYAGWVVSAGLVLYRSSDGAILALEAGNPASAAPSPLPQERLVATPGASGARLPRPRLIRAERAASHAGQPVTVEGRIAYAFNNGKQVLLSFRHPHQGTFKVLITKSAWDRFDRPLGTVIGRDREHGYREGTTISVTGTVTWYQGDPVVYVTTPAQLKGANDAR